MLLGGLAAAVVVGAVGLEVWLRGVLVPRLTRLASAALGTSVSLKPDLGLHAVAVLRRHVPYLQLRAEAVPVADGRGHIAELVIDLTEIRLCGPWTRLQPTFEDARFRAHLRWSDVRALVSLPTYLRAIDVAPDGLRLTTLAGVAIAAHVDLHPGQVRLRPTGSFLRLLPTQHVVIDLPSLPLGAAIESMRLGDGTVDLAGRIDTAELAAAIR